MSFKGNISKIHLHINSKMGTEFLVIKFSSIVSDVGHQNRYVLIR
jgi:hypothetical protein